MLDNSKPQADGAQTPQGSERTSEGQQGTPFTQAQVEKLVNDRLAAAGRDVKALELREATNKADRTTLDSERQTWRQERDVIEEAALRDDPDSFRALKIKRDQERRETDLGRREGVVTERETRVAESEQHSQETRRQVAAHNVAAESGVDMATLLKFTDGTEEAMRELAATMGKVVEPGEAPTLIPDSGRGGGSGHLSWEQAQKAPRLADISDAAYERFVAGS